MVSCRTALLFSSGLLRSDFSDFVEDRRNETAGTGSVFSVCLPVDEYCLSLTCHAMLVTADTVRNWWMTLRGMK